MGLNWSQGLRRAAAGLGEMADQNTKNWQMLYQQARDQNLMRFNQEKFEYEKGRDVVADKFRGKQFNETVRARKAAEEAAAATREATNEYRKGQQEHQVNVLEQTKAHHEAMEERYERQAEQQDERALTSERRYAGQAYADRVDSAFETLSEAEQAWGADSEQYKDARKAYDSVREQQMHAVNKVGLDDKGLREYMKLEGKGLQPETINNWLVLSPEERASAEKEIEQNRELAKQKGLDDDALYDLSIKQRLQQPQEFIPEANQQGNENEQAPVPVDAAKGAAEEKNIPDATGDVSDTAADQETATVTVLSDEEKAMASEIEKAAKGKTSWKTNTKLDSILAKVENLKKLEMILATLSGLTAKEIQDIKLKYAQARLPTQEEEAARQKQAQYESQWQRVKNAPPQGDMLK